MGKQHVTFLKSIAVIQYCIIFTRVWEFILMIILIKFIIFYSISLLKICCKYDACMTHDHVAYLCIDSKYAYETDFFISSNQKETLKKINTCLARRCNLLQINLNTLNCGVHSSVHVNTMVLSYLIRMLCVEVQLYCVLAKRLRRRYRRCQYYC